MSNIKLSHIAGPTTIGPSGPTGPTGPTSSTLNITKASVVSFANTTGSNNLIDTFDTTSYRTASYELQILNGSGYQISKFIVVQNGTNAFITEFSGLTSYTSLLGSFASDISSSNVNLYFSPNYPGSTRIIGERITIDNVGSASVLNLGQNYDMNINTVNAGTLDLDTFNNYNNSVIDLNFT